MNGNQANIAQITFVQFDSKDMIDVELYRRLLRFQMDRTSSRLRIIQGPPADELYYLSDKERQLVLRTLVDVVDGKAATCTVPSLHPLTSRTVE